MYAVFKSNYNMKLSKNYKPNPNPKVSKSKKSNIQPILNHLDELRVKFLLFEIY